MQKYAIVSVEPLDKKTLQLACTTLPVDIISIDLGQSSPAAKVDATMLRRAAARNVYIELQIAGAAPVPSALYGSVCADVPTSKCRVTDVWHAVICGMALNLYASTAPAVTPCVPEQDQSSMPARTVSLLHEYVRAGFTLPFSFHATKALQELLRQAGLMLQWQPWPRS